MANLSLLHAQEIEIAECKVLTARCVEYVEQLVIYSRTCNFSENGAHCILTCDISYYHNCACIFLILNHGKCVFIQENVIYLVKWSMSL